MNNNDEMERERFTTESIGELCFILQFYVSILSVLFMIEIEVFFLLMEV